MLNYVAKLGVAYLVFGPWRDPTMAGWPYSPLFPEAAWLPSWGHTNVNLTLLIARCCQLNEGRSQLNV